MTNCHLYICPGCGVRVEASTMSPRCRCGCVTEPDPSDPRVDPPKAPEPDPADRLRTALEFIARDVRCCSLEIATQVAASVLRDGVELSSPEEKAQRFEENPPKPSPPANPGSSNS